MNALVETARAGGPLMVPLGVLCVAISYWVAALSLRIWRIKRAAPRVLGCLDTDSREEAARCVRAFAGDRPGVLARVALYALAGPADAAGRQARFEEARLIELPSFEREIGVLKAMVAAAPLIGLLGTVKGMVATFSGMSARGVDTMEALSTGVSEALVTTQVGLIVAVPGLLGLHATERRLARLEIEIECIAARLTVMDASHERATGDAA
ncbi:MAG: MotA/TolQ/ExbB proton channel family protein [Planctomycetota bacterium]